MSAIPLHVCTPSSFTIPRTSQMLELNGTQLSQRAIDKFLEVKYMLPPKLAIVGIAAGADGPSRLNISQASGVSGRSDADRSAVLPIPPPEGGGSPPERVDDAGGSTDVSSSFAHSQLLEGPPRPTRQLSISGQSVSSQQSEVMDVMRTAMHLMKSLASRMPSSSPPSSSPAQPQGPHVTAGIPAPQGLGEAFPEGFHAAAQALTPASIAASQHAPPHHPQPQAPHEWSSARSSASARYPSDADLRQELDVSADHCSSTHVPTPCCCLPPLSWTTGSPQCCLYTG